MYWDQDTIIVGDRVRVRGHWALRVTGTVKQIKTEMHPLAGMIHEYGVLLDDGLPGVLVYYNFSELQKIIEEKCECGAQTAYAPNVPPGHAYFCPALKK